jgi:hypothetical protein
LHKPNNSRRAEDDPNKQDATSDRREKEPTVSMVNVTEVQLKASRLVCDPSIEF